MNRFSPPVLVFSKGNLHIYFLPTKSIAYDCANKDRDMPVSFSNILSGRSYSRPELARLWKYSGYQALARGVVTPRNDNKIILFVTGEKQEHLEQYNDELTGNTLYWDGPTDHYAEKRLVNATDLGVEIHVFYRKRHHSNFNYEGMFKVVDYQLFTNQPSKFIFRRNS